MRFIILCLLILTGCSDRPVEFKRVEGSPGLNGTNGLDGTVGPSGANGFNSLINLIRLNEVDGCKKGGVVVESGLDLDRSGSLEDYEIGSISYVCDGLKSVKD